MALRDIVRERLAASGLGEPQRVLVQAAVALVDAPLVANSAMPSEVFLTSLSVEGFRGIGQKLSVSLRPGAGLTVITGRNGSGKSSLAESIELLLTGENARWSDRKNSDLRKGWKNLHHKGDTNIDLEMSAAGNPMIKLARHWSDDILDAGAAKVQFLGKEPATIESLGWSQALKTYRPFL